MLSCWVSLDGLNDVLSLFNVSPVMENMQDSYTEQLAEIDK